MQNVIFLHRMQMKRDFAQVFKHRIGKSKNILSKKVKKYENPKSLFRYHLSSFNASIALKDLDRV